MRLLSSIEPQKHFRGFYAWRLMCELLAVGEENFEFDRLQPDPILRMAGLKVLSFSPSTGSSIG